MLNRKPKLIKHARLAVAGVAAAVLGMVSGPGWSADEYALSATAVAQESTLFRAGPLSLVGASDSGGGSNQPIPLVLNATGDGFDFDLGDSETRKLQLFLDSPLSVNAVSLGLESQAVSFPGRNSLGLDATLELPVSPSFSLTGDLQRRQERRQFQPLGSIQCTDGVLRPYSYTASGCRFIGDSLGNDFFTGLDQGALSLGARYDTRSTSTAVSWFTRNSTFTDRGTSLFSTIQPSTAAGADLLTPVLTNPLLPGLPVRRPLSYFDGQASGVDLSFQLGVATDGHGDLRFGLALTRVTDADFSGMYSSLTPWDWTISDPFNTAQMNMEWSRGNFSGGIQGFYREQVDFLNRDSLDSYTTFDVHFTWRTPWNADFSVGASNILNNGPEDNGSSDSQPTDPFESIYGRIPYVRYKQDL